MDRAQLRHEEEQIIYKTDSPVALILAVASGPSA